MKQWLLLFAIVPALVFTSWAFTEEGAGAKKALDLPSGGPGTDEDDEDAPETINFFGAEFEGDAFFWCFCAYEF
ncbi:MAG: hypothetical protein L0Z55_07990 [Planctomycetes bacterium]|nr:hypothetical protein [Planctomycetota bacterium]